MIDVLKEAVLDKAGIKISGRGDCHLLSALIIEHTDEFISYNTLRRMYGFAPAVKPRIKTLDLLSQFCGYSSFQKFCIHHNRFERWKRQVDVLFRAKDIGPQHAAEIIHSIPNNLESVEIATQVAEQYLAKDQFDEFAQFIDAVKLIITEQDYMAQLYFGNKIGLRLIHLKSPIPKGLLHPSVISLICTIHVNYAEINRFYGRWLQHISKTKQSFDIDVFIQCALQTKQLLECKPIRTKLSNHSIARKYSALHPILRSRVLATLWIEGQREFDQMWRRVHDTDLKGTFQLAWFHELNVLALVTGDLELAKQIYRMDIKLSNIPYYELHHLHIFFLLRSYIDIANGNRRAARKTLSSFDATHIRVGYRNILHVVHIRLQLELDPKSLPLRDALSKVVEQINLPIFRGNWSRDYFDK